MDHNVWLDSKETFTLDWRRRLSIINGIARGYMAPEYAMNGIYAVKSDVFGFGVLLLEIINGTRNAGFQLTKRAPSLIAYASKLWDEGKGLELVDRLQLVRLILMNS